MEIKKRSSFLFLHFTSAMDIKCFELNRLISAFVGLLQHILDVPEITFVV